nr:MAG TPA: hypothetical protein [Caudoviricetes sp.]
MSNIIIYYSNKVLQIYYITTDNRRKADKPEDVQCNLIRN